MIADFGIARAGDDPGATATGLTGVRGTPSFMSPEKIAGDRAVIGPRSDVFALGATLYCLVTGRPPFQAASVIETLDLVRTREPAAPRTLVPGVPRDVETIALTCQEREDWHGRNCIWLCHSPHAERRGFASRTKRIYEAQLSTLIARTADRSVSVVTTVQLPRLRAMAAI